MARVERRVFEFVEDMMRLGSLQPDRQTTLTDSATPFSNSRPRITSRLGLVLLEAIKELDAPQEILEDENPSHTMPRRLGLSGVVERQIVFFRDEVRRGGKMTDEQARDLMRLVIRRPDAEEVFWHAGRRMAGESDDPDPAGGLRRLMPRTLLYALARRQVRRGLQSVYGRRIGGFAPGPFAMEGRSLPFITADPGGAACHFVSGYCQTVIDRTLGSEYQIVHSQCQGRKDPLCRWTITGEVRSTGRDAQRNLTPELETG